MSNRTVRLTIAPHLSGKRIRLRLTNRFGDAPLKIAHVTVATAAKGGGLNGASLRHITFRGKRTVAIPPGKDLLSDPVTFDLRAFRKIAVSIAVSGTVQKPTEHAATREINYWTPNGAGDKAAATSGSGFTQSSSNGTSTGWYFLDGIDVVAPSATGAVVAFGDSITDGFEGNFSPATEDFATVGKEQRYPDFLQRRLQGARVPLSVLNNGIGGNRVLSDGWLPSYGPKALSRLDADAVRQTGVTTVIFLEGINDIGQTPPGTISAQQLIDGYTQIINRLHGAGLRVLLGTLTPSRGAILPTYGVTPDQVRVPVNQWIRAQNLADGVIDFDKAVRDPADPSRIDPAYDDGEHLHFSAAGYKKLAATVPLGQLAKPRCVRSLAVRVSPRHLTAGITSTVRVLVRQAGKPVPAAHVQLGHAHASTDRQGIAHLRVRFARPGVVTLRVSHDTQRAQVKLQIRKMPRRSDDESDTDSARW